MKEMTQGQHRDFGGRIASILKGAGVSAQNYQAFHEGGRTAEFASGFRELVEKYLLNPHNPFADEWVKPADVWDQPSPSFHRIDDQLERLHKKLGLKKSHDARLLPHPRNARFNGVAAVPFLRDLGTAFKVSDPTGKGYGELAELVLSKVVADYRGNICDGVDTLKTDLALSGREYVRLNVDVRAQLQALEAKTPAVKGVVHYHALNVSLGKPFAGFSSRKARIDALQAGLLPLGVVQALCLPLGSPDIFDSISSHSIGFPADECDTLGLYCNPAGWSGLSPREEWDHCLHIWRLKGNLRLGLWRNDGRPSYQQEYHGSLVASQ